MTQYQFTINGASDLGKPHWNKNGTLGSLVVTDNIPGTADSETCSFTQDDLGRLASAACGTLWEQTFSADPFGNVAKTASPGTGFSASFNIANQIASVGGVAGEYDANGNLENDPSQGSTVVNTYDAENRPVTFENVSVAYDALGRAVEAGGNEFLYGPGGAKLAEMTGQTLLRADIALPGGGEAAYTPSGLIFYRHADWLGRSPLLSTPSRTMYVSRDFAPYGEGYQESSVSDRNFTGQKQEIALGQYDFPLREYSPVQGRWWTPDPAGVGVVNPNNPQSWNRYAYVSGSPLEFTDPLGLTQMDDPCSNLQPGQYCTTAWASADSCPWYGFWCWGGGGSSDSGPDWGPGAPSFYQPVLGSDDSGDGIGGGTGPTGTTSNPCPGARTHSTLHGLLDVGLGAAKIGLGVLAAPETGGASLYSAASGLSNLVSGGAELYGGFSGNLAASERVANYAASLGSVSGVVTLVATGNAEYGANASAIESLATLGVTGGLVSTGTIEAPGLADDAVTALDNGAGAAVLIGIGSCQN